MRAKLFLFIFVFSVLSAYLFAGGTDETTGENTGLSGSGGYYESPMLAALVA